MKKIICLIFGALFLVGCLSVTPTVVEYRPPSLQLPKVDTAKVYSYFGDYILEFRPTNFENRVTYIEKKSYFKPHDEYDLNSAKRLIEDLEDKVAWYKHHLDIDKKINATNGGHRNEYTRGLKDSEILLKEAKEVYKQMLAQNKAIPNLNKEIKTYNDSIEKINLETKYQVERKKELINYKLNIIKNRRNEIIKDFVEEDPELKKLFNDFIRFKQEEHAYKVVNIKIVSSSIYSDYSLKETEAWSQAVSVEKKIKSSINTKLNSLIKSDTNQVFNDFSNPIIGDSYYISNNQLLYRRN